MVAGGTGITPMLQVVDEILENKADQTKVSLIFANQSEADILLKKEIDARAAANPDRFKVYYVVDKAPTGISSYFFPWSGGVGYVTEVRAHSTQAHPAASVGMLTRESSWRHVAGDAQGQDAKAGTGWDGILLWAAADVQGDLRAEGHQGGPEGAGRARRAAQADGL